MAGIKKAGEAAGKGLKALIGGVTAAATAGYSEDAEAKNIITVLTEIPNLVKSGVLKAEHVENKSMVGKAVNNYKSKFHNDEKFRDKELSQYSDLSGKVKSIIIKDFDPRFDNRVLEQEKLKNTKIDIKSRDLKEKKGIELEDLIGRGYVSTMSDRTAAGGKILGIDGVYYDQPVDLRGGQDYMFDPVNEGSVWASAKSPVSAIMGMATELKNKTGQNPVFLPWRMTPSGGDFSSMTSEVMLTHARNNMSKSDIKKANKEIRAYYPKFKGLEDPDSVKQLYGTNGDIRKAIIDTLDKGYRDKGGLSLGQARLAVSDQAQVNAKDARLHNVGEIDVDSLSDSTHPTYSHSVPGQGLGELIGKDKELTPFDLNPEFSKYKGVEDPSNPPRNHVRSLESGNALGSQGIITEEIVRAIRARQEQGGYVDPALLKAVVAAGFGSMLLAPQDAEAGFIGPKAITWSKDAAAKAQELLDKGVDPEAVRKITGIIYNRPTHVGSEGNLRQEISDKGSKFVGAKQPTAEEMKQFNADKKTIKTLKDLTDEDAAKLKAKGEYDALIKESIDAQNRMSLHKFKYQPQVNQGPLSGFLDNKALYEAYPELKNYDTTYRPNDADSWYRDSTKQISVGGKNTEGIDDTGKALHETQHGVQSIEGNARGGSVNQFMPDAQAEYDAISNEIKSLNDLMRKNVEYRDELKARGGNDQTITDLEDAYDELISEKIVLVNKINNKDAEAIAFEKYLALPGEREARATAERKDMDIMERVKNKPSNLDNLIAGPSNTSVDASGIQQSVINSAKTDYEIAHAIAQKNAALPIEQGGLGLPADNTAMDRARAMGFDVKNPVYHGTNKTFDSFNRGAEGIYFTDDKKLAGKYGRKKIEALLKYGDAKERDALGTGFNDLENYNFLSNNTRRMRGDSSVIMRNFSDSPNPAIESNHEIVAAVNNPSQISSPNAAFDPLKRNSSNLLASAGAGSAVAGGALYTPEENQAEASPLTYSSIFDQQDAPLPVEDDSPVSYSGIFSSHAESDVNPPVQLTPEQPVMQQQPSYIDQNIAQLRDTFAQRRIAKGGTIRKQNQINAMSPEELKQYLPEQAAPDYAAQNVSTQSLPGEHVVRPDQVVRGPESAIQRGAAVAGNAVGEFNKGLKGSPVEILSPVTVESMLNNYAYNAPGEKMPSAFDVSMGALEVGGLGEAKAVSSLLTPAMSALFSGDAAAGMPSDDQEVMDAIEEQQRIEAGQPSYGEMLKNFIMR